MQRVLLLVLNPIFVIVTIKEVDSDNYMRGRSIKTPAAAPEHADDIIKSFFTAMEARDLEQAKTFWLMIFR